MWKVINRCDRCIAQQIAAKDDAPCLARDEALPCNLLLMQQTKFVMDKEDNIKYNIYVLRGPNGDEGTEQYAGICRDER